MKKSIITVIFTFCTLLMCNYSFAQCGAGETEITISFPDGGSFPGEISFFIDPDPPGGPVSGGTAGATFCAANGVSYDVVGEDSFGDGWNGADIEITITEDGSANGCEGAQAGCILFEAEDVGDGMGSGPEVVATILAGGSAMNDANGCPLTDVMGCTTATACNFDPCATIDDGSCVNEGDVCDDGIDCTSDDVIQADCSCMGTITPGLAIDCEDNCVDIVTDLQGTTEHCPGSATEILVDDLVDKGGDGVNIWIVSDNVDGAGTPGTLGVFNDWSFTGPGGGSIDLFFDNPTCEEYTANLTFEITCWPDNNDPANVILTGSAGSLTVYPEPFSVNVVAPTCGGIDGIAELLSADGTVCASEVLEGGMVGCGTDTDADASYDFGSFFTASACPQGPFASTDMIDCELCTCPTSVDYVDPLEMACGSAMPSLPAAGDLLTDPSLDYGVEVTWTPDPTVPVEPMGCDEETVVYTATIICLVDDSDITPAANTHTLTVYPTLTSNFEAPLCDNVTNGIYEVLAPDGTVCDMVLGTAGDLDEDCTGGAVAATLSYGPTTFFAGTPCEQIFEEDFNATCDPSFVCSADCLTIDINEVDAEACSGVAFALNIGVDNSDGADVDIYVSDDMGNTFGPFNDWEFGPNAGNLLANYVNEACDLLPIEFTYQINCWNTDTPILSGTIGTVNIAPAQPTAVITNVETEACSGQANVMTVEMRAANGSVCDVLEVPASFNMTCGSSLESVGYLWNAANIASITGGSADCYTDLTGSEDMTIYPAQPVAVVTNNEGDVCSEATNVITVELRSLDGTVCATKMYDASANMTCEVIAEDVAYEWTVAEIETITGAPAALACYSAVTGTEAVNVAPQQFTANVSNNVLDACSEETNVITVQLLAGDGTVCNEKMYNAPANNSCAAGAEDIAYAWTAAEIQTLSGSAVNCYVDVSGDASVNIYPAQHTAEVMTNVGDACSEETGVITVVLKSVDGTVCDTKMYDAPANNTCAVVASNIAYEWTAAEIQALTNAPADCYAAVSGSASVNVFPAQPSTEVTINVGTSCSEEAAVVTVELKSVDGTVCATKNYSAPANLTCAGVLEDIDYGWTAAEIATLYAAPGSLSCYADVSGTEQVTVYPQQLTAEVANNLGMVCSGAGNAITVQLKAADGTVCSSKSYPAPLNEGCGTMSVNIDYEWTVAEIEALTGAPAGNLCYLPVSGSDNVTVFPVQPVAVVTDNVADACSEQVDVITIELRAADGTVCATKTENAPLNNTCSSAVKSIAYAWTVAEIETITGAPAALACYTEVSGAEDVTVYPANPSEFVAEIINQACSEEGEVLTVELRAVDGSVCDTKIFDASANFACGSIDETIEFEWTVADLEALFGAPAAIACYTAVADQETITVYPVQPETEVTNNVGAACSEAEDVVSVDLKAADGTVCATKTFDAPANTGCEVVTVDIDYEWTLAEIIAITGDSGDADCFEALSGTEQVDVAPAQPNLVLVSATPSGCDGSDGLLTYRIVAADGVTTCINGSVVVNPNNTCNPAEVAIEYGFTAADLAFNFSANASCYTDLFETETITRPVIAQAPVINRTEACIPGNFGTCSYEVVAACGNDVLDAPASASSMEASGFAGAMIDIEVETEDGCIEIFSVAKPDCDCNISLEYADNDLSDPCACNADQSANGAGDGTFSETVTFTGTCGLTIVVGSASTPASLVGLPFTSTLNSNGTDCDYTVTFNHQDKVGYYVTLENDLGLPINDSSTGEQYAIGNVCEYPVITEPDLDDVCESADLVASIEALSSEVSGLPGTMTVSINGGPALAASDFDPAVLGVGAHTIDWVFTGDFVDNIDGTLADPANPGCQTEYRETVYINPEPVIISSPEAIMVCDGTDAIFNVQASVAAADHLTPNTSAIYFRVEALLAGVWTHIYTQSTDVGGVDGAIIDEDILVPAFGELNCSEIRIEVLADHDLGERCGVYTDPVQIIVHNEDFVACNDTISFSINADCSAETRISMFLESENEEICGEYVSDYLSTFYMSEVMDADGNPIADADLPNFIGQCLDFKVTDLCTDNYCWGVVCIEDKVAPLIENCDDLDAYLYCFEFDGVLNSSVYTNPTDGLLPYPVINDCGDDYVLTYRDEFEYLNEDDPKCGDIVITRTWVTTESAGAADGATHTLTDTCKATYTLVPFDMGGIEVPSKTVTLSCGQDAHPDSIMTYYDDVLTLDMDGCDLGRVEFNEGVQHAYPFFYAVGCDGNMHAQPINNNVCNIFTSYSDLDFAACLECPENDHKKITRTWTFLDWCTGEVVTYEQIIKAVDDVPPVIEVADYTAGIDPWNCLGNFTFQAPEHLYDDCTHFADYIVTGPGTIYSVNEGGGAPYAVTGVPKGENTFYYEAFDCCGNVAVDTVIITVIDDVPPTPITLQDLVVGMTTSNGQNGIAKVFAEEFDNGSHDGNCGPVRFEVRRGSGSSCLNEGVDGYNNNITFTNQGRIFDHENDTDNGEFITFCCEDLDQTDENGVAFGIHKVWFRVFDSGTDMIFNTEDDNFNESWINVRVEDKLFANVVCPPDVTICCGWDPDDQTHTGVPTNNSVCHDYDVEVRYNLPLGDYDEFCNEGTIQRTYDIAIERDSVTNEVTQWGGHGCTQLIYVEWSSCWDPTWPGGPLDDGSYEFGECADETLPYCGGSIDWPADETLVCTNYEFEVPTWDGTACDRIAWSVQQDTFWFEEGACFKLLNNWTVLNECVEERYPGYGTWTHTQVVKFFDDQDPIMEGVDTCYAGELVCEGMPTLVNKACDTLGECMSEWIKWEVKVDIWGDWTFDYEFSTLAPRNDPNFGTPINEFYIPATMSCEEVMVKLPEAIPVSKYQHRVVWRASDGCGNIATQTTHFTVEDKKAPTPYCLNVSTALMDNGELDLWACDFDLGSFDDCTELEELRFTFTDVDPDEDPDYNADLRCSERTFTCQDIPTGVDAGSPILVDVYVWDECGNKDFCTVELDLIDNSETNLCDEEENARILGSVKTELGESVEDVQVVIESLLPDYPRTHMTNEDGDFDTSMHPHGHNYNLTANKDIEHLNGVSTIDIVMIQRHILGLGDLTTPYKMIAADVNEDQLITGFDLVEIRKLILNIYAEFPNTDSWQFVDAHQSLTLTNPFAYNELLQVFNLTNHMEDEDFIAVKMGDVNNSVQLSAQEEADTRSKEKLYLSVEDKAFESGELVETSLTINTDQSWFGFQFTLSLDGLSFESILENNDWIGEENIAVMDDKNVTFSWNDINPIDLDAKEISLRFTATKSGNINEAISVNSSYTKAEAYTSSLSIADVVIERENISYVLHQNEPNPFMVATRIAFELPRAQEATISIYDMAGKVIKTISGNYQKGLNEIVIEKSELGASNVYYYQLEAGEFTETKKMISIQ